MVRREHRTKAGGDHVEAPRVERELLGVGDDPLEREAERLGLLAASGEALGSDVGGDHVGACLRGTDCDVPGAGCHVEDPLTGRDPARVDEQRSKLPDGRLREPVVVTERPNVHRDTSRLAAPL